MRQRRESRSGIKSSMVHKRKEDRRREAIGFEIPVTRGAFDVGVVCFGLSVSDLSF